MVPPQKSLLPAMGEFYLLPPGVIDLGITFYALAGFSQRRLCTLCEKDNDAPVVANLVVYLVNKCPIIMYLST